MEKGVFMPPKVLPILLGDPHIFHQMPEFVEVFVVSPLVFAIFLGRNDHLHLFLSCLLDNRVGVVGSIPQEIPGIDTLYKGRSLRAIRRRPFCDQNPSDRRSTHFRRCLARRVNGAEAPLL